MNQAVTEHVAAPAIPDHHAKRTDIVSVDSSNFDKFVDEKMGITPTSANDSPEAVAAIELAKIEEKKSADEAAKKVEEDPTHDVADLADEKKRGINERFSKLSAAKRAAEESAAKAVEDAKTASARVEQLEKEAKELRALKEKYEPTKTEPDQRPDPANYTEIEDYTKAIEQWAKESTKLELAKEAKANADKAAQESVTKSWQERQEAYKATNTDYAETIAAADLQVYNECGQVIIESDVGPEILYHLAKNPELVEKMKVMSISRALVEVGKLEAKFGADSKPDTSYKKVEISKAPAPISSIKAGSIGESSGVGTDGEWTKSFAEYKAARLSGKIK